MDKQLLTTAEAAAYLGVSKALLAAQRMNGPTPHGLPPVPYTRLGRSVKYRREDLDRLIRASMCVPGEDNDSMV